MRNKLPRQKDHVPRWPGNGTCNYCSEHKLLGCNHFRGGKTRIDRQEGSQSQNTANKMARAAWSRDRQNSPVTAANRNPKAFPVGTCNGKKTRALSS